ncbi:MAG: autotransporter outer membrane beta-barrel domain-containing protein [Proteobacteria bacterium]|nr:autotransporter outer membrane beta-barrel domain-containing protein [Pseudomonadota bacterium]NOG59625.1 autotransporter outer membrane beta-barrel domain-containing protein [Pseudomonadota bacterium]
MTNQNKLLFIIFALFMNSSHVIASDNACSAEEPTSCLNGVGPAVTNPDSLRMAAKQISKQSNTQSENNNSTAAFFGESAMSGLAAGDGYSDWGVWSSISHNKFGADIPINSAVQPLAKYDAYQSTIFVGADKLISDKWVLGLTVGYENTDIDTKYNGGDNKTDGFTIAPYMAYLINDIFSVDMVAGYTSLSTDTDRIDNVTGSTVSGDFDADRWFVATNLNATVYHGQWVFGGRLGLLYTEEDQDAYTERGGATARTLGKRHIDLTQGSIGANLAYTHATVEPFASITYYNDLGRDNGTSTGGLPAGIGATQPTDDDEFQTGLGVRYFGDTIDGTFEWNSVISRDNFDGNSVLLTLRMSL